MTLNKKEELLIKEAHEFSLKIVPGDGDNSEDPFIIKFLTKEFNLIVDFSLKWNDPGPPYVHGSCLTLSLNTPNREVLRVAMLSDDVVQVLDRSIMLTEQVTPDMVSNLPRKKKDS